MAAPHVAGVAALMLSVNPWLTAAQLRDRLESSADTVRGYDYHWDANHPGHSKELGYGRINAYKAVAAACESVATPQSFAISKISIGGVVHPRLHWDPNQEPCLEGYNIYKKYRSQENYELWRSVVKPDTCRIDSSVRLADSTQSENIIDYCVTAVLGTLESTPSNTASVGCDMCPVEQERAIPHAAEPTEYSLAASFPNPFNPTTVIIYTVPQDGQVTLKIYDVLGKEVAILVDEFKETNWHSIVFDASLLPSGVYFYRIQAGKFTDVKKAILVR